MSQEWRSRARVRLAGASPVTHIGVTSAVGASV